MLCKKEKKRAVYQALMEGSLILWIKTKMAD